MQLLRSHPLFSTFALALLLVVGAEAWVMVSNSRKEAEQAQRLEGLLGEIEILQRRNPAPTQENLRAAHDDFVQNALVLDSMLRSLNVGGPDELEYFKGEPAKGTDAYFDIAQFVERMQRAASEAGVTLRPEERFGFSIYANVGPEDALIRPVYRQRRIVEYLLRALFSARPKSLVSVQREQPRPSVLPDREQPAPPAISSGETAAKGGGGDFFVIDPQVSARTPGYVDTMAFRIAFTGQTAALRGFMNALAAPEIPLVVRSVEVGPAVAEGNTGPGGNRAAGPPATLFGRPAARPAPEVLPATVPIVAENVSRFTVTVELFEVKIRAPDLSVEGGS